MGEKKEKNKRPTQPVLFLLILPCCNSLKSKLLFYDFDTMCVIAAAQCSQEDVFD
jgi:hypothetical protein